MLSLIYNLAINNIRAAAEIVNSYLNLFSKTFPVLIEVIVKR